MSGLPIHTRYALAIGLVLASAGCRHSARLAELRSPVVSISLSRPENGSATVVVQLVDGDQTDPEACAEVTGPLRLAADGVPIEVLHTGHGGLRPWWARIGKGGNCEPLFVSGTLRASSRPSTRLDLTDGSKTISVEVANLTAPRTIVVQKPLVPGARATLAWQPPTDLFVDPGRPQSFPDGPNLCVDFIYADQPPRVPDTPPRGLRIYLLDYQKVVHAGRISYVNRSDARLDGNRISFTVPKGAATGPGALFLQPCDRSQAQVYPRILSCRGAARCFARFQLAWQSPGPYDGEVEAAVVAPARSQPNQPR